MKKIFRLLSIIIAGLVLSVPAFSKILMSPYLQALTNSSVVVMLETNSEKAPIAVYFTVGVKEDTVKAHSKLSTKTKPKTFVHRIKLDKLQPGTRYHYHVADGNEVSARSAFNTLPAGSDDFTFAIMGDCRSGMKIHSKVAEQILAFNPLFSLYNGDLCYNSTYQSFKEEFFITEELNLISQVPFFNSPGNHEGWSANTKAFTEAPESKSNKQEYYSFDASDIHYLVLNTEISCKPGSPQYKFAQKDLASTDKKFKIVTFHESAYCGGGHGDNAEMRTVSENLFEKYAVDIVFSGHSHFYQHNLVNGVHHLTVAGGGAPLYPPKDTEYTKKSLREHHFGIAEYSANVLKVKIYDLNNNVIDELIIDKNKK